MSDQPKDKKINEKELKIYIIDDCRSRRNAIKAYFESVQQCLKNGQADRDKDFEDCEKCFIDKGIEKVVFEEILPDDGKADNSYYVFKKDAEWVLKIGKILKQREFRVFLVDLALSEEEAEIFRAGDETFTAATAKDILMYIDKNTCQNEYVIFESIARNLVENLNAILDIFPGESFNSTRYDTLLGSYFQSQSPVYEKVEAISAAFGRAMEEIKNGQTRYKT